MSAETVIFFLVGLCTAIMVVAGVLNSRILRRLKDRHTPVWEELGSPRLFLNNSIQNNLKTTGYFWRGRHKELGDDELTRLARISKALAIFYYLLLAVGVVLVVRLIMSG